MCKTQVDWVEGAAILVAACIVAVVGSANDWQKERQLRVLNARKEDRSVTVVCDGKESAINVKVGIIFSLNTLSVYTSCQRTSWLAISVCLNLENYSLSTDASCVDTMSDATNLRLPRKAPFEACWAEHNAILEVRSRGKTVGNLKKDPFLISGSKVMRFGSAGHLSITFLHPLI